jgi:hypothetical protein
MKSPAWQLAATNPGLPGFVHFEALEKRHSALEACPLPPGPFAVLRQETFLQESSASWAAKPDPRHRAGKKTFLQESFSQGTEEGGQSMSSGP